MKAAVIRAGSGSCLSGFTRAGFNIVWSQEVDGSARQIQRENDNRSFFRIPQDRERADVLFFVGFRSTDNDLLRLDNPRGFLIESEELPDLITEDYDLLTVTVNSSRFFSSHARIRNYTFGVKTTENEAPPFVNVLQLLSEHSMDNCRGMSDSCDDLSQNVLITPYRKSGRMVYKSIHPCPEIHARAGKKLTCFEPHPCDSALQSEAKMLREDQLLRILNLTSLKKPRTMTRQCFFKWAGKSLDPDLAELLGRCMKSLIGQENRPATRDPVIHESYAPQVSFNKSAMAFITGANTPSEAIRAAEGIGIEVVESPRITMRYKQGSVLPTDLIFNQLAGKRLAPGTTTTINERRSKAGGFDRVSFN